MMRDGDRIDHMLSFTRRCIEVLDGVDKAQFLDSVDKQESLELNFLHLGEAAARVSEEVKLAHEEIPWHKMAGLRNMLAHEYFRINPVVLFETVKTSFHGLEQQLTALQQEFPL